MNTIIERITEAIKDILIGLIKSCLDNMFTSVNEQVGTIAGQVGQTPQGWNAGIFNLIQNISQTVIVPIAGLIITFVLCYELITMVTQKNNFHEFETYQYYHADSVNYHYGNLVRKNDRNLPLYFHSTNSVCHHDQ